jgi:hypothetical protein
MPTVSIIYFTGAGHTAKLAEAVDKGATSVAGVKTKLIPISGDDISPRLQFSELLCKCPLGSSNPRFVKLIDQVDHGKMTRYFGQAIPVKACVERHDCVSFSDSRHFKMPDWCKGQSRSLVANPM